MEIGPEAGIVGALITALGGLFVRYERQVARELAAKDAEIAWLRSQLAPWTAIAQTAVTSLEKVTTASIGVARTTRSGRSSD
jgi:hypothetical protein